MKEVENFMKLKIFITDFESQIFEKKNYPFFKYFIGSYLGN